MRVQKVFFNGAEGKKTVQNETGNLDLHWFLNSQAKIVFTGKSITCWSHECAIRYLCKTQHAHKIRIVVMFRIYIYTAPTWKSEYKPTLANEFFLKRRLEVMFTPSSSFNQPPEWTLLFTSYDISLCFRLAALAKQVFEPDYLMLDTMKDIGPSTRMV